MVRHTATALLLHVRKTDLAHPAGFISSTNASCGVNGLVQTFSQKLAVNVELYGQFTPIQMSNDGAR
jgi:hypothetical protein